MLEVLKSKRQLVELALARRHLLHTLSLSRFQLHHAVHEALRQFCRGDVLEAGAGLSPYAEAIQAVATSVTRLDVEARTENIDVLADIQDMSEVHDDSFDTAICTQVIEHVPYPDAALRELARVLRPSGRLILSAPHLSMIHEAPSDYFRFTQYGLRRLCDDAGFRVVEIKTVGGLMSLIFHTASLGLMSTLGALPFAAWPVWAVNYFLFVRLGAVVDNLVGWPQLFPRDYLVIAEVTEGPPR